MAVDSQALAAHFARKKRASNAPPTATQDQLQRFVDEITKGEGNALADEERDIALATAFKFSFCLTDVNESSSKKKKKGKKKNKKKTKQSATAQANDGAAEKASVSTHAARDAPKQQTKKKPSSDPTPVESGRTPASKTQKARTPKNSTPAASSSASSGSVTQPAKQAGPTNAVRLRKATGSESELVRMQLRYGRGRRNLAASAQREHRKKESVVATGTSGNSSDSFKFNFVS